MSSLATASRVLVILALITAACSQRTQEPVRRQQQFAIHPTARTAIVGDTVVLPCRVTDKQGVLQWTKDGFGLGTNRNLSGFPRYQMIGTDDEGDYSLQISSVALEDDAVFQCQVGAVEGVKGIRSHQAQFTVFAPPNPPKILQGANISLRAGETVNLKCESLGGKPAADIFWIDGDGNTVTSGVTPKKSPSKDNKRQNSELTWSFVARKELDQRRLTCKAENRALKQPLFSSILVQVQYAPEVTLTANKKEIHEFDTVRIECKTSANPPPTAVNWYRNDEPMKVDESQNFVELSKLTRKVNGDVISCEAHNAVGVSRANITLNVIYKPQFKANDKPVMAQIGTEVAISCDVDSNPKPEIMWTRGKSAEVLGRQQVYVIREMTSQDVGVYTCRASAKGFEDISHDYHVYIKGAPKVESPALQYATEGTEARVECLIQAVPPATKVQWFKDGMLIDTDKIRGYHIAREILPSGENNVLVIERASASDFGEYNCSVTNVYGEHSLVITLLRDSIATTMLMFGAAIVAVFVVLFAVIMTVCLKRRSPPEDFKETMPNKPLSNGALMSDKDNSSSGGESDIKVEIRTASSLSNTENISPQHTAMDNSWDSGVPPDTTTLPPYKRLNDYAPAPYQSISVKPECQQHHHPESSPPPHLPSGPQPQQPQLNSYGSIPPPPPPVADYMSTNSDYGVMVPMQSLPPLSPVHNTMSPVHHHHPGLGMGGIGVGGGGQLQLHHMPVMTNNSLYATGGLSAALMLPQYAPDPNHASLSLSECGSLPRPCSQMRMATAHPQNQPATAYISSTLPYRKPLQQEQQANPPLSPVAQRRYITASPAGRNVSQFKSAQLATHV